MNTKALGLGVTLTLIYGKLLCDMGEVYEALNFLTGEELYTHQLPRAMRYCRPYLVERFPSLCTLLVEGQVLKFTDSLQTHPDRETRPKMLMTHVHRWVQAKESEWGKAFEVQPLPHGVYEPQDPIDEAIAMRRGQGQA